MPVVAVRALLLALAFLPSSTTADVIAYSYYTDAVCATSSLVQKYVEDSSSTCTPSSCADDSSSGLQRTIECPTTDVSSSISSLASTLGFSGFKSYTTVFGGTTSTCLTVEKVPFYPTPPTVVALKFIYHRNAILGGVFLHL